jgi:hypothetical protein
MDCKAWGLREERRVFASLFLRRRKGEERSVLVPREEKEGECWVLARGLVATNLSY